jgi:hypothetical protein
MKHMTANDVAEQLAIDHGEDAMVLSVQLDGYLEDGSAACYLAHIADGGVSIYGSPLGDHGYERFLLYRDGHYAVLDHLDRVIDEGPKEIGPGQPITITGRFLDAWHSSPEQCSFRLEAPAGEKLVPLVPKDFPFWSVYAVGDLAKHISSLDLDDGDTVTVSGTVDHPYVYGLEGLDEDDLEIRAESVTLVKRRTKAEAQRAERELKELDQLAAAVDHDEPDFPGIA